MVASGKPLTFSPRRDYSAFLKLFCSFLLTERLEKPTVTRWIVTYCCTDEWCRQFSLRSFPVGFSKISGFCTLYYSELKMTEELSKHVFKSVVHFLYRYISASIQTFRKNFRTFLLVEDAIWKLCSALRALSATWQNTNITNFQGE